MKSLLLKSLLKEIVLLNEITEETVLYHRSFDKFKVGDVINPSVKFGDEKNGTHWLKHNFMEQKLEEARKEINPKAPSRFKCVYCSVVPNSAFSGKGYLYEVKPIGNFHATLAYFINKMNNEYERAKSNGMNNFPERKYYSSEEAYNKAYKEYERRQDEDAWYRSDYRLEHLFEWYWKGINVGGGFKENTKWIEVLCDKAKVVSVHGKESYKYLSAGDEVEFMEDMTIPHFYGYDATGNKKLPREEIDRIVKDFHGEEEKSSFGPNSWKLIIPKGTRAKVKAALLDQSAIKNFDVGDYKGKYTSPYRVLKLIPNGYDFYVDARSLIHHKNYDNKDVVPVNDIFRKIS